MEWYKKTLEGLGYKVYYIPFGAFSVPFNNLLIKDRAEGDAMKTCKEQISKMDVTIFNALNSVFLDFVNPQLMQQVFSPQNIGEFQKLKMFYKHIERAMGVGVPFSEGKVWKRKRKIITTVFNFEFIKGLTKNIQMICENSFEIVEEESKLNKKEHSKENEVEYYLLNLTVSIFSTVMIECFFGDKATHDKIQGNSLAMFVTKLINDLSLQGEDPLFFLLGPKFLDLGLRKNDRDINRRLKIFRSWATETAKRRIKEIQQNREQKMDKSPSDLIEALVKNGMFSEKKGAENAYTEEEIIEEFSTFFIAGTDTTSHYLVMMIYYIALNPEVEKKLREEIETYMKDDDYSYQNLKNLKYIDYIQKQTTRIYGPVNGIFPRVVQYDKYIKDIPVKKGTCIMAQPMGNHYSEKYFKDPKVFRPERWEKECDNLPPFALGGFGGGMRSCIGKHLAMVESKIAIVKIMKRYKEILLPKKQLKMDLKFVYIPEEFETRFILA